ncbi:major facilitator superfamily protein [Hirsutella rhossiliensis]
MGQQLYGHARLVASVAATLISLACGTNYVYSAWAPQFAERLDLSSTQSNLIGLSGNLGVYSLGVPVGVLIDRRGPRPFVLFGAALLAIGYFSLHQAYDSASGSVATLCFFSYLSGLGSCMAFAAAVKTSALNWPHHRGTATAFPVAAFGLSAFFFSSLGSIFFPGNPSAFLKLLSWGTFGLTLFGFFFLRVSSHRVHEASSRPGSPDPTFRRTLSAEAEAFYPRHRARLVPEPGRSTYDALCRSRSATAPQCSPEPGPTATSVPGDAREPQANIDETSSLMPPPLATPENVVASSVDIDRSRRIDFRGLRLLRTHSFWHLFSIMAILAGTGLMTINNIGNNANALWKHFDDSVSKSFLVHRQQMLVSALSVCSFVGRLLSGVGSDFLVRSLHASRLWCLFVACLVFLVAQVFALSVQNPHLLGFVSAFSGLGHGVLFGVFPSLVTEAFGIRGLSQNWGFMMLAPVASSNVFNLLYGTTYDGHSAIGPDGKRSCRQGLDCYRTAYWITFGACCGGLVITLQAIRHERLERAKDNDGED